MEKREHDLMAELQFYRFEAEMRAMCDECKTRKVMVALNNAGEWLCFECLRKANPSTNA